MSSCSRGQDAGVWTRNCREFVATRKNMNSTLQSQELPLVLALGTSMPARGGANNSGHCRSQLCASFQYAPVIVGTLALRRARATTKQTAVAAM